MGQPVRTAIIVFSLLFAWALVPVRLCGQVPPTFVYTNDNINGPNTVTAFSVGSNGALTSIGSFLTGGSGTGCTPTCLFASNRITVGAGRSFLYASDDGSNDVSGFSVNPISGALSLVPGSPFPTGGSSFGGISLAATPDGRFLMAGSAGSATITIFSIAANGALTAVSTPFGLLGSSPQGLKVSPDGAFLAVGNGGGTLVLRIASDGTLSFTTGSIGFSGEVGVDINCSSNALYAAVGNGTGVVDGIGLGLNGLSFLIPGSPFPNGGLNSSVVLLNPTDQFLFVSDFGGSVSVFSVAYNGSLTQVSGSPFSVGSGFFNSGLATNPEGTLLFTANDPNGATSSSISVFSVGSAGALTAVLGSPFPVAGLNLMSIAVFPAPTCSNPVPLINQSLVPDATSTGGSGLTLTVNGSGFVSSSVVNWNGTPLATTFVTRDQLTAVVPASNIATAATASVTVTNPAPGGGTSNVAFFTVTSPTTSLTFGSSSLSVGIAPKYIAVADFNNDGKPDLAVVNSCGSDPNCLSPGTVSILLGNGDGTFSAQPAITVGTYPVSVAVADFNGDGHLDLAVVNNCPSCESGSISILLGNGKGAFTLSQTLFTSPMPTDVIAADFIGDGRIDLAFCHNGGVDVFLGNGDGTFGAGFGGPLGGPATALTTGDFNSDGILDLAVAIGPPSPGVTILLGNGNGTFAPAGSQPVTTLVSPLSIKTGDFKNSGILDLVFADGGSDAVTVLLGNGDGTFNQVSGEPGLPQFSGYVAMADLNGDGKLDLAFGCDCPQITILLGNGEGTFQSELATTTAGNPVALGFGDFNGDGRIDVATANGNNTVSVLLQSPVTISTTSLPGGTVGSFYSQTLQATGGTLPYSWALATGSLPPGLSLSTGGGVISGTPTTVGTYAFTVRVTDANGSTATQSLSIVVAPVVTISTTSLPGGTVGSFYSQTLQATGGTLPYSWALATGSLPPGLSLSVGGVISGTPTAPGAFSFTVKVTDANGSTAAQQLSIAILQITTTTLPNGTVGFAYSQPLQATGGTSPYVWTVFAGSLPVGLSLSSAGIISGTPTTTGTYNFTVMATDAKGNSATAPLSIVVVPSQAPAITTQPASQTINPQQTATLTVVATGAPPPTYQWYEGQSGDTSIPIPGATGSSFTTPQLTTNTSYWVQVSNGVSPAANSATATITINLTCTLAVQGSGASGSSNPLSITATVTCVDIPGESFTISVNWGDGTSNSVTNGVKAPHLYAATGNYVIVATATTASEKTTTASSSVTLIQVQVPGVFPGQTSDVPLSLSAPGGPFRVTFTCTTVTNSSGVTKQASDLGISCSSIPSPVTLPVTPPPPNQPNVTITIATSGPAMGFLAPGLRRGSWLPAMWLPLAALVLFGAGWRKIHFDRKGITPWLVAGVLVILLLLFTSCSGGFTAPVVTVQPTPAGNYQVTVVSQPAPGQTTTGFVQTSLIVPLPVSPTP